MNGSGENGSGKQGQEQQLWLLKTEPEEWSWQNQAEKAGLSVWDGVRNPQAQKFMKEMQIGDLCLFYHTGKDKEVVGIVRVVRTFYQDPTDDSGKWGAVDVQEVEAFKVPVTLAQIKSDGELEGFRMLRQPRLSVVPVEERIWERLCELGGLRGGLGDEHFDGLRKNDGPKETNSKQAENSSKEGKGSRKRKGANAENNVQLAGMSRSPSKKGKNLEVKEVPKQAGASKSPSKRAKNLESRKVSKQVRAQKSPTKNTKSSEQGKRAKGVSSKAGGKKNANELETGNKKGEQRTRGRAR